VIFLISKTYRAGFGATLLPSTTTLINHVSYSLVYSLVGNWNSPWSNSVGCAAAGSSRLSRANGVLESYTVLIHSIRIFKNLCCCLQGILPHSRRKGGSNDDVMVESCRGTSKINSTSNVTIYCHII
jgi:hypothetical protein